MTLKAPAVRQSAAQPAEARPEGPAAAEPRALPADVPGLPDVLAAAARLRGMILNTELRRDEFLSRRLGAPVWLKLENRQLTGSFKIRGAANKLLSLTDQQRRRGVVAFSTGNHGRAVAAVARQLGVTATVCLSRRAPTFRVEALRALGAETVVHGESQDEAMVKAFELQKERGLTMVAPFDDPHVIAGQGTTVLEIFERLPDLGGLVVPLSGGGLFAGAALTARALNPAVQTFGVSMAVAPAMIRSLEAGRPVEIPEVDSLADALLGGVGLDNRYTFELTRRCLTRSALVDEDEIARGMIHAFERERLLAEGSGAVGLAALLADKIDYAGPGPLAVIVSGGNLDPWRLHELAGAGRGTA
ncbi:MAG: threonine/serine dehydratase [Deltaproteobacteria bacterium]|jgi:threonine dehydratase|nr:threonine/serine dehydratase [Deltaproteobacteria bacterium]